MLLIQIRAFTLGYNIEEQRIFASVGGWKCIQRFASISKGDKNTTHFQTRICLQTEKNAPACVNIEVFTNECINNLACQLKQ